MKAFPTLRNGVVVFLFYFSNIVLLNLLNWPGWHGEWALYQLRVTLFISLKKKILACYELLSIYFSQQWHVVITVWDDMAWLCCFVTKENKYGMTTWQALNLNLKFLCHFFLLNQIWDWWNLQPQERLIQQILKAIPKKEKYAL